MKRLVNKADADIAIYLSTQHYRMSNNTKKWSTLSGVDHFSQVKRTSLRCQQSLICQELLGNLVYGAA
jgi:hypothetical protein